MLKQTDNEPADLLLKAPPSLTAGPGAVGHYALLVEPGEYAFSYSELKIARSVNKVDTYSAGRKMLIQGGKSLAGSFKVGAGELVYIGHFATDCVDGRTDDLALLHRGREGFQEYLANDVKTKYPFLDTGTVQYRLFETNMIGANANSRGNQHSMKAGMKTH